MKSPFLVLHKAESDRLEAQTSYKIFDDMPEQEDYTYVVLGEVTGSDWSDKFKPGQEVFSTIHIWSKHHGRKEVAEMIDGILQALTTSPLDLAPNFRAVLSVLDMNEIIIDIDGETRHGILRIRYLVEEI